MSEGHAKELALAGKLTNPMVPFILANTFIEFVAGNEFHDLSEDGLALVHQPLLDTDGIGVVEAYSLIQIEKSENYALLFDL